MKNILYNNSNAISFILQMFFLQHDGLYEISVQRLAHTWNRDADQKIAYFA
jgi:penicillin-binding protein-related factor A (putative recombinase)